MPVITFAAAIWIVEAAAGAYLFGEGTFVGRLLPDDPNELFDRVLLTFAVVSFFVYQRGRSRNLRRRKAAEEESRQSRERFEGAFQHSAIGMALVGTDGRWLKVNRSLCDIIGYPEQELLRLTFQDITHPEDLDKDLEQLGSVLRGEIDSYQMEKRYFTKGEEVIWIMLSVSLVHDSAGDPAYFVSQIEDITARKELEFKLLWESRHDPLTGLLNRPALLEEIESRLAHTANDTGLAVLYVDLDGFKEVNDSLGHDYGDRLLIEFSRRIVRLLANGEVACRIGGDEFVVLVGQYATGSRGAELCQEIERAIQEPFVISGARVRVEASIGVAHAEPGKDTSASELIKIADRNMYRAKIGRAGSG